MGIISQMEQQGFQGLRETVDEWEIVQLLSRGLGVPPHVLRSREEYENIVAMRQKMQNELMQMQMAAARSQENSAEATRMNAEANQQRVAAETLG